MSYGSRTATTTTGRPVASNARTSACCRPPGSATAVSQALEVSTTVTSWRPAAATASAIFGSVGRLVTSAVADVPCATSESASAGTFWYVLELQPVTSTDLPVPG